MANLKKILPWFAIIVYLIVAMAFVNNERKNVIVNKINVDIVEQNNNYFIDETEIIKILNNKHEQILGSNIDTININNIENILNNMPATKQVDVYRNLNGELNISVEQRNPVLRVITALNESFYIDEEGFLMPLSRKYSAHVLIANGGIRASYTQNKNHNFKTIPPDSVKFANQLYNLYQLACFIKNDKFWASQIEQIYINNGKYELVPRVGRHIIKLGTTNNYEQKMRNLKALYQQGLPKTGWNNYKTINLEFEGQIVCTKI